MLHEGDSSFGDHRTLVCTCHQTVMVAYFSMTTTQRLLRWWTCFGHFRYELVHIPGGQLLGASGVVIEKSLAKY